MRIVFDMQGMQATSRNRGIGRYTQSFVRAIIKNCGNHEIFLALNGLFPETLKPLRTAFADILPQENIRVWSAPESVSFHPAQNGARRRAAELIREAFLASLRPDIIHVSSLFEGWCDNAVTSVGSFTSSIPTSVTLYDLIPLIHKEQYLTNPDFHLWYTQKLAHLKQANLCLAISESSRQEALQWLGLSSKDVINVSCAIDETFSSFIPDEKERQPLCARYTITRPFLLYVGGIDPRKNVEGLIRSFGLLPRSLRMHYQLVIACSISEEARYSLQNVSRDCGLEADELIMTGFVTDEELKKLYSFARLFVFPSLHEGFGLPVLEAMQCGTAVIAANTSSIPEVVGLEEALFDPYDDHAIASKMQEVLTNEAMSQELSRHGKERARLFSWDETAKKAVAAFESLHEQRAIHAAPVILQRRPRLAYVSPMPPERTGIADYSAQLLPELASYYEIDLITDQKNVSDVWANAVSSIHTSEWLLKNSNVIDRVVYHFGNSYFHVHMLSLLRKISGTVVLHDFFLSDLMKYFELLGNGFAWTQELYHAHGYTPLCQRFDLDRLQNTSFSYPVNLSILQQAEGIITHSAFSKKLAEDWYGRDILLNWEIIPLARKKECYEGIKSPAMLRREARKSLGLPEGAFIVCSFGYITKTKCSQSLLSAWLHSRLSSDPDSYLLFVGECSQEPYGKDFEQAVIKSGMKERVRIIGWTDAETFQKYLECADSAVQLRTLTRGETSAAVLDCMSKGLPVISNANGSFAELPSDAVRLLPDAFEESQLSEALEFLWENAAQREQMGAAGRAVITEYHSPARCAALYHAAIEQFHARQSGGAAELINQIATRIPALQYTDCQEIGATMAWNFPLPQPSCRQLFVDVSELIQRDAHSGIQRVTRSILKELLDNPPTGYRVEPVWANTATSGYRYARKFTSGLLEIPQDWATDASIEAHSGDMFLGLDLQPFVVPRQRDVLHQLSTRGVEIRFVVYDLLPVTHPEYFIEGGGNQHAVWLQTISEFDGAVCISKATADELIAWMRIHAPERVASYKIDWFHLGADLEQSLPTTGIPADAGVVIFGLRARPTFLMVSTLEPRKGYEQALEAIEELWQRGVDVNLVIVGKEGWCVEELVKRLKTHRERGKRLFWLNGISDEYLEQIYAESSALLMTSYGEGFGLALIEAARHKKPLIIRDIPVFREVAEDHAFYFDGMSGASLADAIECWLKHSECGTHPLPEGMPVLTWKQSTDRMLNRLGLQRKKSPATGEDMPSPQKKGEQFR